MDSLRGMGEATRASLNRVCPCPFIRRKRRGVTWMGTKNKDIMTLDDQSEREEEKQSKKSAYCRGGNDKGLLTTILMRKGET